MVPFRTLGGLPDSVGTVTLRTPVLGIALLLDRCGLSAQTDAGWRAPLNGVTGWFGHRRGLVCTLAALKCGPKVHTSPRHGRFDTSTAANGIHRPASLGALFADQRVPDSPSRQFPICPADNSRFAHRRIPDGIGNPGCLLSKR